MNPAKTPSSPGCWIWCSYWRCGPGAPSRRPCPPGTARWAIRPSAKRCACCTLAAKVGLSRAAFAARFAALVGEPPLTYLTGWRMTLAADLLRDTEETVAAVAGEVGYTDAFAFSVAFKRARGVSPSVWRRQ
ncbi:helix-turn-helix protein [Herbihabitans rhizosphaerae]|uniref:Helix-turn-helix protein n=1 Tax=Herbihabitans rhizosphaerae TaxID=1872711 RepID=A0A4Q7KG82_9PSEU|nr:helix-turn-helix protein [Herbihabitans rhizosphaerae]